MDYSVFPLKGSVPNRDPGLSLKAQHYQEILSLKPALTWFELHPENLVSGTTLSYVQEIRKDYLLSFHSVGLSLGSPSFNDAHLQFLVPLARQLCPSLISTHVSWNYHEGTYFDGLLPLPYNLESFQVVADNIAKVQDAFGQKILVENPAAYTKLPGSTMDEATFIIDLSHKTGCGILLDVNNIYINSVNHGVDAKAYLKKIAESGFVEELHLGGHEPHVTPEGQEILLDTHNGRVSEAVWQLYAWTLDHLPVPAPTLIEWDASVPSLKDLLTERARAQNYIYAAYEPERLAERV